jgi:hypothetical protein
MSEPGEGAPGSDPAPIPRPAPIPQPPPVVPPPSNTGPNTGNVIGGVFLIGCGLLLLLAGGSCTALLVMVMAQNSSWSMRLNTISMPLGVAIVGLFDVVMGIRLVTKRK